MPGQIASKSRSTFDSLLPFQRLDVYVAARELAALVHAAGISDHELRDQATRAAKSCFLALAEGLPHESAGQRGRYFATSKASLCEAVAGWTSRRPSARSRRSAPGPRRCSPSA